MTWEHLSTFLVLFYYIQLYKIFRLKNILIKKTKEGAATIKYFQYPPSQVPINRIVDFEGETKEEK
jgi:hypothetical protein